MKNQKESQNQGLEYRLRVLLCIAQGLVAGESDNEIVSRLNAAGLRSERGLPFNSNRLRQLLKCLRNPLAYPSSAYRSLRQLHAQGKLTAVQCLPLLRVRRGDL